MTLDVSRIATQLDRLAEETIGAEAPERYAALRAAYGDLDPDDLRGRLRTAKTSWLVAAPAAGAFHEKVAARGIDGDFAVVASDGSFIVPDRNIAARFFLINVGKVVLRYGAAPDASLSADPHLYFGEDELNVPDVVRRIPITGTVLGLKRAVEELRGVADEARRQAVPTLALQDGTLILWSLEGQPESVVNWILESYLETMRDLRDARIPVAAFISYPGSSDVVNSLRVSICDYPSQGRAVNCDACRSRILTEGHVPACDVIPPVSDRFVYEQVAGLRPGERSAVFASGSRILERYDEDFRTQFFYVHTGTEIARVEVPRWVAADSELLDFTHSVIDDQCRRGRGYPSALQEAHELAAIRPDERRAVELMIVEAMARRGFSLGRSAKDGSKRTRFV